MCLLSLTGDANAGQNPGEVIRHETVAGPLTRYCESDKNSKSLPAGQHGNKTFEALVFGLHLYLQRLAHLPFLRLNKRIMMIPICIMLHQNPISLLSAVLVILSSRRLIHEPKVSHLDACRCSIKHSWRRHTHAQSILLLPNVTQSTRSSPRKKLVL